MILETTLFLILIVILCVAWFVYSSTRHFDYWEKRAVPHPKPVPIFGNIKDMATCKLTQAECLQNIYRTYNDEKFVGMFQMGTPTLLIRDPDLIKQLLVKDFQNFTDRGFLYDEQKEPLTAHLINMRGARWRTLRQKLTPTFSTKKIKNMIGLLQECSEQLIKYVQELLDNVNCYTADIEMRELTARFTTDVIGSCAFGLQFNSMSKTSSEFRRMGHKALRPSKIMSISKLVRVFFPTLFRIFRMRTFPKEVNQFFLSVVSETLHYREKNNIYREDFLQLLLQLRSLTKLNDATGEDDQNEIELTDNLITAQAFVFFLAGFETSSTTLSFCLYELAVNEHYQRNVSEEILATIRKYGNPPFSYEALKEMNYLEQCLLETMRKYPPVQALARVCTKPYTIPNTSINIDLGTALLIPVYALHHDDKYYPDPEKFDPSRFSKDSTSTTQADVYYPFGDGPRICIGMRFAMLEMKLSLATFLYSYEIKKCPQTSVPLQLDPTSFILAPKNGIWLTVNKRNM